MVQSKGVVKKEETVSPLLEPFIIYAVLFFPGFAIGGAFTGISGDPAAGMVQFTIIRELARIIGYNIPSFLLIWYLAYIKGKKPFPLKVQSGDFQSLAIALPGLLGIGLAISVTAPIFSQAPPVFTIEAPRGAAAILVMILSCFSTGYLEETYFRHYLLTWFRDKGLHSVLGLGISVLLFSLCHVYEGLWGVLNAAMAGALLGMIYKRYGSLHGLAWAHGLYNAFIYMNGV
jgi:membrane protease YdiL (CAAX protease family)